MLIVHQGKLEIPSLFKTLTQIRRYLMKKAYEPGTT